MTCLFDRRLACTTAIATILATGAAAAPMAPLAGSVVALSGNSRVTGDADPSATVDLEVALRFRSFNDMVARTARGVHVTPAEMSALYFPTETDYDAVVAWLRSAGLTITAVRADRSSVGARGPASSVAAAFATHFSKVSTEEASFVSADIPPSVPAALASSILSVNGLQPQLHADKLSIARPLVNDGYPPYGPGDLLDAYNARGLGGGGVGTTTAIVIDTFPNTSDLTSFWQKTGVTQSLANISFIQTVAGTLPAPTGEESLDVETTSALAAPHGKVRVYAAQNLAFTALDAAFRAVIDDLEKGVAIGQVSISLGACETGVGRGQAQTDDQYFATMQAMGASVFVSSGDSGSTECGGAPNIASFYSTSPNVTAVGGTTLNLDGSSETYLSEAGWSGSGGGISRYFGKPSYQGSLFQFAKRAVPDVASDANPGTGELLVVNGQSEAIGGTSLSAPTWAGLMALVNEARRAAGKPTLGALDPRLYPLEWGGGIRDIWFGNNGGYQAGFGYDLVTGLGSPKLSTLLPQLVEQN